ncbi:transposase [Escherichia coli]|nr:transposase [Escherichia coli]EKQ0082070.1 transposase [Escherichia coli]
MSRKYLIRITELERLLSEQAEALRQKEQQLSLVEETEAFLRSALARAEEKIEEEEWEIEHLRAQIEKLRRMLFGSRSEKLQREVEQAEAQLKQREQESDRYSGRENDPQVPRQLRQSRHRRPLPAHLPREIHRLEPEESCCPECGSELDYLGEVSAEQLELVSSALCQRQRRPARQGVELSRALLSNWVDACCQLMIQLNEWMDGWMVEKNGTLSKKSRLGEAFSYVLNQWEALCYYSDDGLAEADNNTAERALRAVCLGKKNYMFFGNDHVGERGALLYGLIGNCRLNGIDPEAYLRHILSVLPKWLSNRVDELLPWKVVFTDK